MAILMADLSGYTALTETHGAAAAADVVDRYLDIVKNSLVGDSHLHERTGDEVMLISSSADNLLATALMLMQAVSAEENFLLLHGGLHWGKLLHRNNSYFGTAINLTSRIASKAGPGSIWCSQDFVDAVADNAVSVFVSKGKHSFKNMSNETELFELQTSKSKSLFIDPVCRMLILDEDKSCTHPELPGIYFCSNACMELFMQKRFTLSQ
jgi:class 3 adenylate cyclase